MSKGICTWCGHKRDAHFRTQKLYPPTTKTACMKCDCRKYEA